MKHTLVLFSLSFVLASCATAPTDGHATTAPESSTTSAHEHGAPAGETAPSAMQVFQRLQQGHARFCAGTPTTQDALAQMHATAGGQHPMAFVLGCIDSRVPPEMVFDCGIGDLFVGRVAGNLENGDLLGSMEYATKVVGTPLIVVLGHSSCGAIKGACDNVQLGNLTGLLAQVQPAIDASPCEGERNSHNKPWLAAVIKNNVLQTMQDIPARSEVIRDLVAQGKVTIVGGVYDLATGAITWLD